MALTILSVLLLCATSFADLSKKYSNNAMLESGSSYKVYWTHNATSNMMYIALEVKATGWVALAFAKEKSTSMKEYDACLGSVDGNTKVLKDYLTNGHMAPAADVTNDCVLDEAMETNGMTTLKYHRKVDTGDSNDVVIQPGEIVVVWAFRNTVKTLSQHDKRGFKMLTMISADSSNNSGQAVMLTSLYWKFVVASLSIAVAMFFK
ncbi:DBH-like monooxygenase protein 1 [Desmophyllum pertusum]|uniref:DBH-like monooxygenase protein 1 n=1 Tax=Desmophyllum pertusum TaxID=174260 RepID=A0A9W9Z1N5_9CNID|nr:DBH-like monooxygenase protein 1 [Desmophyllum pertusum]